MIKKLLNSGIFWTIVVGIVGIGLTILFYEYSNKDREPVYAIKKEPSIIFDKENSTPKIKLLSNDSILINENVYVSSIVIWNNGELEIKKDDVRKEFMVTVSNAKVLDYQIVNQTNPEISNFKVEHNSNELLIDWDYFDPKFGFELQIIYSGVAESEIKVSGYVLGREIKKVSTRKPASSFHYILIINLVLFIILAFAFFKIYKEAPSKFHLLFLMLYVIGIPVITLFIYKGFFGGFELPL